MFLVVELRLRPGSSNRLRSIGTETRYMSGFVSGKSLCAPLKRQSTFETPWCLLECPGRDHFWPLRQCPFLVSIHHLPALKRDARPQGRKPPEQGRSPVGRGHQETRRTASFSFPHGSHCLSRTCPNGPCNKELTHSCSIAEDAFPTLGARVSRKEIALRKCLEPHCMCPQYPHMTLVPQIHRFHDHCSAS